MNQNEIVPCRQYTPRRRKNLTIKEQEQIVEDYLVKYFSQKEIAQRFRIKT